MAQSLRQTGLCGSRRTKESLSFLCLNRPEMSSEDLALEVTQTSSSVATGTPRTPRSSAQSLGCHLSSNNYIRSNECCFRFSFYGCSLDLKC